MRIFTAGIKPSITVACGIRLRRQHHHHTLTCCASCSSADTCSIPRDGEAMATKTTTAASPSTHDDACGCLGLLSAAGRGVEFAAAALVGRKLQFMVHVRGESLRHLGRLNSYLKLLSTYNPHGFSESFALEIITPLPKRYHTKVCNPLLFNA